MVSSKIFLSVFSYIHIYITVEPVYKGYSMEHENVTFMSRPLYTG